ncbi:MAG: hypothetical protein ACO3TX_10315, partial [Pseudomonadales bacterium]
MVNPTRRLLFVLLAPLLLFGAILIALFAEFTSQAFEDAEIQLAEQLLTRTESSAAPFLRPLDPISLQVVMDDFHQALPEAAISLIDREGNVIVAAGKQPSHSILLSRPLVVGGEDYGRIVSHLPVSPSETIRKNIFVIGIALLLLLALGLTGLALYLGDFLMLWLGFPAGTNRAQQPILEATETEIDAESDTEYLVQATLHLSPGRLVNESTLRKSLLIPSEGIRRMSEGTYEITLLSSRPDRTLGGLFEQLESFLKVDRRLKLRGALLLDLVNHEDVLRKKS